MKLKPYLVASAIMCPLLIIGLFFAPSAFATTYFISKVQNLTGAKVNCPTYDLKYTLSAGRSASGGRGPESWNPGDLKSDRLGDSTGCTKAWIELTCVSLADGWPRILKAVSSNCSELKTYFKLKEGKLILSTKP